MIYIFRLSSSFYFLPSLISQIHFLFHSAYIINSIPPILFEVTIFNSVKNGIAEINSIRSKIKARRCFVCVSLRIILGPLIFHDIIGRGSRKGRLWDTRGTIEWPRTRKKNKPGRRARKLCNVTPLSGGIEWRIWLAHVLGRPVEKCAPSTQINFLNV